MPPAARSRTWTWTSLPRRDGFEIEARVRTDARTGAEMEALHAVAVAALTVYDMVKAADQAMTIGEIRLVEGRKTGAAADGRPYRRGPDSDAEADRTAGSDRRPEAPGHGRGTARRPSASGALAFRAVPHRPGTARG